MLTRLKDETEIEYIERQKAAHLESIGLTGVGVEHHSEHYTENAEGGIVHHKRIDYIYENGELLVKKPPHRQILNPESKDYSIKLAEVTEGVQGTLAIQQSITIAEKEAEKESLALLRDTLAERLDEEKTKYRTLELQYEAIKRERDDLAIENESLKKG